MFYSDTVSRVVTDHMHPWSVEAGILDRIMAGCQHNTKYLLIYDPQSTCYSLHVLSASQSTAQIRTYTEKLVCSAHITSKPSPGGEARMGSDCF